MSLMREVTALIEKHGPSTVDDIVPLCPNRDRLQVRQALNNARRDGYLEVAELGTYPGGGGRKPAKFALAGQVAPMRRALSSVWDLGAA